MEQKMMIWNTSVSRVGGKYNTRKNFDKIANDFRERATKAGFSEQEIEDEIASNFEASARWM